MELPITLYPSHGAATTRHKRSRTRRPPPAQEGRDSLTPNETALVLGCSVATVHRLRHGLIPGIETLPFCQCGRKAVFRKAVDCPLAPT
jgi:hypothetical protein